MFPKLSVIVPVYGVEKYIERCARSLMSQTLNDVEYIFVNDCTKDSSMAILLSVLDEFPDRRSQVHIISHEQNMGLPAARRTGLAKATGDYILHCDSDDWMEPNCCETAYCTAIKYDADVVVFKNWIDNGVSRTEDNGFDDSLLASNGNSAISATLSLKSSPYVWNKLVRRDIYDNDFVFPKNNLAEDWVMSVQFAYRSKRTVCIEDRLYHYFSNANSIMHTASKEACFKKCADEYANVSLICGWLEKKGLLNVFKHEITKRKIVAKSQLKPILDDPEACRTWRRTFSEINLPVLFSPHFGWRDKMYFLSLETGLYRPLKRIKAIKF